MFDKRAYIKNIKTGLKIMVVWFIAVMLYFNVIIQTQIVINKTRIDYTDFYVIAALVGLFLGLLGAIIEVYFQIKQFKKASFFLIVVSKTIMLFIAFVVTVYIIVLIDPQNRFTSLDLVEGTKFFLNTILHREFINHLFYTFVFGFVINLCVQINKKMGPGVLLNLVLGRYHKPRKEVRIFAFLDLISSSLIAEQLTPELYSSFIKDFFYDIDAAIERSKGSIFQYVGDEVVVIWKKSEGINNNNCVNLFFEADKQIKKNSQFYINKYGLVPDFKIGIHIGEVVITEVGGTKKEIAYHGDVINTASRIRSACTELNERVLISADLLSHLLNIDDSFIVESKGVTTLKGKENIIGIFSIKQLVTAAKIS